MFAPAKQTRAKTPTEKSTRPERVRVGEVSSTTNPIWQSLAFNPVAIQPRLALSRPDDPSEREADHIADHVMRMEVSVATGNKPQFNSHIDEMVQRTCDNCEEEEEKKLQRKEGDARSDPDNALPPIVHQAVHSSGRPQLARQAAPSPSHPESEKYPEGEAAPKEETRPLNEEERVTAGAFEIWRKLVLGIAIMKLQDFTERIITGDPSLSSYNPSVRGRGLNEKDLTTLLAIQENLDVFANTFDWLNDPMDKTFLEVTMKATDLMIQNLGMEVDKVFSNSCSKEDTMAMAWKPMWLCPDFFGEPGKHYKDPLCPALVLTHEYFHYLNVPGSRQKITHGEWTVHSRPGDEALSSAFDLSNLAMALAVNKNVECQI